MPAKVFFNLKAVLLIYLLYEIPTASVCFVRIRAYTCASSDTLCSVRKFNVFLMIRHVLALTRISHYSVVPPLGKEAGKSRVK